VREVRDGTRYSVFDTRYSCVVFGWMRRGCEDGFGDVSLPAVARSLGMTCVLLNVGSWNLAKVATCGCSNLRKVWSKVISKIITSNYRIILINRFEKTYL